MPVDAIQKELEDMESKLKSAREVASRPGATERDKSDLKLIEQQFLAAQQKVRRAPDRVPERAPAEGEADGRSAGTQPSDVRQKLDKKLDAALKDSFPGSDPVSFVEAAPVKEQDRALPAVEAGEQQAPDKTAAARRSARTGSSTGR
jgi:hypothetical protein